MCLCRRKNLIIGIQDQTTHITVIKFYNHWLSSPCLQKELSTHAVRDIFHRWDVEASYHHLLVATYRIDPILRCEHHDAIREKERICWKRERGGAHFDYTSGRDIFRYTPKLAWKRNPHSFWRAYYTFTWTRVIFKNANHKKNPPNSHNAMHQCCNYSFCYQKNGYK